MLNLNAPSNLHAANATSVVGNAMPIPQRAAPSAAVPAPTSVATGAAAAAAQLSLNHARSGFKPAVPVAVPSATPAAASMSVAASATTSAVPNTAGAGALQLSGRWSLDRDDSDSTNDYLEAMGLPLIARQAADKLDLMVIINQTAGEFVITRRTRIFTETKALKFGQEVNVKNNVIKVTGEPAQIRTTTQLSGYRGMLTDVRTLDDKGRMRVELTLALPDKPPVVITRYFNKTSESTSLENLPAFDMSLENTNDVKRKR
ncbi:hypothetical protein PybrP1_010331 [[Pythium] brassicae (nom. inval.)]|nr:hypothetical protein PybrP1_010331 [[Pythium] brassicae (nom. inval.)]